MASAPGRSVAGQSTLDDRRVRFHYQQHKLKGKPEHQGQIPDCVLKQDDVSGVDRYAMEESAEKLLLQLQRLRGELAQSRAELAGAVEQILHLALENNSLNERLIADASTSRDAETSINLAEAIIRSHEERVAAAEKDFRTASTELHRLTTQLERANRDLQQSNAELDARVEDRTRELKIANRELEEAGQRFNLAIQAAEAGAWDWDLDTDRLEWSAECCALHGIESSAFEETPEAWLKLMHPDDRPRVELQMQACRDEEQDEFRIEYRISHPSQGVRWLLARGMVVGRTKVGLTMDITGRKMVEAALADINAELNRRMDQEVTAREAAQASLFQAQKLEALGQLTGGVAHDFNNLLMVISGGLHLLAKPGNEPRRAEIMARVQGATERGADITRRLLAFGRREALRPSLIDLGRRLNEFRELLKHALRGDLTVETDCNEAIWPVHADSGALELALLNLAVNARDAMQGGGSLTLRCHNHELDHAAAGRLSLQPGDYVEIQVIDTGSGMTPEVLAHVFEPFFSTKGVGKGSGLGLSQVYGFVQQSGGTATIRSTPGKGTTVSLWLPRGYGEGETVPVRESRGGAVPHRHAISVLLVEDDPDVGAMVEELLSDIGHRVTRVPTAAEALQAVARDDGFDLLFTDVLLRGDLSGIDLARQVSAQRPHLPIVLTTGYSGKLGSAGLALDLPLLRKPYTRETLSRVIDEALLSADGAKETRH